MQIVNGKMVMGRKNCWHCTNGQQAGTIVCPECKGTGKGKRGKPRGCTKCRGDKTTWTWDFPIACKTCKGEYVNFCEEDSCDYTPDGMFAGLEFKVYRHARPLTGNESLLGIGCVWSCCDYGDAWKANDDAALVAHCRETISVQATKIMRKDGTVCSHVGIFVCPGGYSLRPVFEDANAVLVTVLNERPEAEYMVVGSLLSAAGENGTLGAVYRS